MMATNNYGHSSDGHNEPWQYTISRFREICSSKSASGFDLVVSAEK